MNLVVSGLVVNSQVNAVLVEANSGETATERSTWKISSARGPSISIPAFFFDSLIAGRLIVYPDRGGSAPGGGSKPGAPVDLDVPAAQGTSIPAVAIPTVLLDDIIVVHIVDTDLVTALT